jgi:hypothetical protein
MKRALVIVASIVLALVVAEGACVGGGLVVATRKLQEEQAAFAADQARFRERIMADQRRWVADPLFVTRDGGDAAALMFQHVSWRSGVPPARGLPASVTSALRDAGNAWLTHPLELTGVDTEWMRELAAYGHWDLEGPGTPLHGTPFNGLEDEYPSFVDVMDAARVRLRLGIDEGEPGPALDDVQELARLCFTSERLISDMVGAAVLGLHRRASEHARANGLDAGGVREFSEAEVESLRGALWAASSATSLLGTPTAIAPDFPLVGRCSAQLELAGPLLVRPYARSVFRERYRELDEGLATSPCRVGRLRAAWSTHGVAELPLGGAALCSSATTGPASSCTIPDFVVHLPFVRDTIGTTLVSIGAPDWFKYYRGDAGRP